MPLGMDVGLSSGDFVLDGDLVGTLRKKTDVFCGQTAGCIKMPLGVEVSAQASLN